MKMIINEKNYSVLKVDNTLYLFSYEKWIAQFKNGTINQVCDKLSGDNKKHLRMFKKIVDNECKTW